MNILKLTELVKYRDNCAIKVAGGVQHKWGEQRNEGEELIPNL